MVFVLVLLDSPCIAHIIHRMVETCFNPKLLIPRMHAVAYTCNQHANMNKFAYCMKDIITVDLRTGFFPGAPPHADYSDQNNLLTSFSCLRAEHARGRRQGVQREVH